MSSTKWYSAGYLAVNGIRSLQTSPADGACTNDGPGGDNWWAVDIGDSYIVEQVVVYNVNQDTMCEWKFKFKLNTLRSHQLIRRPDETNSTVRWHRPRRRPRRRRIDVDVDV